MTFEEGLSRTCRFPRFSALLMLLRASARTFIRTMFGCGVGFLNFYRIIGTCWKQFCASDERGLSDDPFVLVEDFVFYLIITGRLQNGEYRRNGSNRL